MCSLKRIKNEKKVFDNHILNNYYSFFLNQEYNNFNANAEVLIGKNNKVEALIEINNSYPFKPPKLYVCKSEFIKKQIGYIDWSFRNGQKINEIIKNNNYTKYELLLVWFFILNKNFLILNKIPHFSLKIPLDCLCCSSILCGDKWSPSIKITDIIIEFLLRKELFNLFTVNGIRYIETIFKNDKWNLSEDIILLILKFIIKD